MWIGSCLGKKQRKWSSNSLCIWIFSCFSQRFWSWVLMCFSVHLKMHGEIYLFVYSCCMENKALKNLSAVIALFLLGVYFIKQICRADSGRFFCGFVLFQLCLAVGQPKIWSCKCQVCNLISVSGPIDTGLIEVCSWEPERKWGVWVEQNSNSNSFFPVFVVCIVFPYSVPISGRDKTSFDWEISISILFPLR